MPRPSKLSGISGKQIVILSSIEWDAAWQRHQIFAVQFAQAGHEVFFVENTGFRSPALKDFGRIGRKIRALASGRRAAGAAKPSAGIHVVNPVVLPPTAGLFRAINRGRFIPKVMGRLAALGLKSNPVVLVYLATATTLEMIDRLRPAAVVYDCASHFAANPGAPKDFSATEQKLLGRAGLVVTDSDFLFDLMKAKHANVIQIHQGVSGDFFDVKPPDSRWKRFCFYGTWVQDMNAGYLNALAEAGFEVAVSGFLRGDPPRFHPSIRRLEPVAREALPRRLEEFDVFLLPHKITEFHKGVIPAKIYECLAMGRPVLGTPLPSLSAFRDHIYISDSASQWVEIARNLPKTESEAKRQARIALAREHTHEKEFARFYRTIQGIP